MRALDRHGAGFFRRLDHTTPDLQASGKGQQLAFAAQATAERAGNRCPQRLKPAKRRRLNRDILARDLFDQEPEFG